MRPQLIWWAVSLAAPAIWFVNHTAGYFLTPLACSERSNAVLLFAAGLALALDAVCGAVAWRQWQRAPEVKIPGSPFMPRWMAMSGMGLSAGFFVVIIAQTLPPLFLGSCE